MTLTNLVAGTVLALFGVFLIGFAIVVFAKPAAGRRFLEPFANSARAHYTEQAVRLLVGTALILFSPALWQPRVFWFVGWAIVLSSLVLILTPWRWHQRFGTKVRPLLVEHVKLFAIGVAAFGVLLLHGVLAAVFSSAT